MADSCPRVGLNAHLLSGAAGYRSAGIHRYIAELLRRLPSAGAGLHYTAFASQAAARHINDLPVRSTWLPTEQPWARIMWEQFFQPVVAAREQLDLLHGLAFVAPLASRCPTMVTVHDLSFALFPEFFRGANAVYLRWFTRMACRRAARIVAVSEHTRADVIRLYDVPAEKVEAIPHGVDARFYPRPASEVAEFRHLHGLPENFILFVGTLEPRKNLVKLIEALEQVPNVKLMLVGGKGWYYDQIFAAIERWDLHDRVRWVGYVPGDDLPLWYNAADVFAFPSRYEGFGMPLLEAMACGTPVVSSNASSLPEVAGDAALTVPPDDADALAEALQRTLNDNALRQDLRVKGLARAATFTWEETARRTAQAHRHALGIEDQ
jgi:glycosyltransferase involved in cell wall biosynthesis